MGEDEVAAFEYLSAVTEPGEPVLTDLNADGSLWMYALAGVDPLFLVGGFDSESLGTPENVIEEHEARRSLAIDIGRYRERRDVADRLADLGIHYVYYGESGLSGARRTLDFRSLRTDPAFVPVFERGAAHVYRIDYDVLENPTATP